jgi:hypothetical protein
MRSAGTSTSETPRKENKSLTRYFGGYSEVCFTMWPTASVTAAWNMTGQGYSMLGFVVIVILYAAIGLMAAAGAISIVQRILAPKAEQVFYAMFLIMIAAFYLAFTAYFGVATAWRLEWLQS